MTRMRWDQMSSIERIAAVKTLMADGLSAAGIGECLGCSRNAVIGLWNRHPGHFNRETVGLLKIRDGKA